MPRRQRRHQGPTPPAPPPRAAVLDVDVEDVPCETLDTDSSPQHPNRLSSEQHDQQQPNRLSSEQHNQQPDRLSSEPDEDAVAEAVGRNLSRSNSISHIPTLPTHVVVHIACNTPPSDQQQGQGNEGHEAAATGDGEEIDRDRDHEQGGDREQGEGDNASQQGSMHRWRAWLPDMLRKGSQSSARVRTTGSEHGGRVQTAESQRVRNQWQVDWMDSASMRECRICLGAEEQESLVAACVCSGTQKWAHLSCLTKWVVEKRILNCELCNTPYQSPFAELFAHEISKRPVRSTSHRHNHINVHERNSANNGRPGGPPPATPIFLPTATSMTQQSTAITNPWSRGDYWVCMFCILAAFIIALYFATKSWTVIVWGIIVAFVPIAALLSLVYAVIGKSIEMAKNRREEAAALRRQQELLQSLHSPVPVRGMLRGISMHPSFSPARGS